MDLDSGDISHLRLIPYPVPSQLRNTLPQNQAIASTTAEGHPISHRQKKGVIFEDYPTLPAGRRRHRVRRQWPGQPLLHPRLPSEVPMAFLLATNPLRSVSLVQHKEEGIGKDDYGKKGQHKTKGRVDEPTGRGRLRFRRAPP
jgi:hypothetical protein